MTWQENIHGSNEKSNWTQYVYLGYCRTPRFAFVNTTAGGEINETTGN